MQFAIKDFTGNRIRLQATGSAFPSNISVDGDPIEKTLGQHPYEQYVLLDMGQIEMLDSSAVGWLLKCHKAFRESGGQLVIHTLSPAAKNTLKILRVDQVLQLAASEQEAMSLLEGSKNG